MRGSDDYRELRLSTSTGPPPEQNREDHEHPDTDLGGQARRVTGPPPERVEDRPQTDQHAGDDQDADRELGKRRPLLLVVVTLPLGHHAPLPVIRRPNDRHNSGATTAAPIASPSATPNHGETRVDSRYATMCLSTTITTP